jgi:sigma-54 dependent transcriptional regulator, acetoin dehydrogenase operon transcriptional activator AcoR
MVHLAEEAAREAARLYRSTGALSETLLRPDIYRAWSRSHTMGADPQRSRALALDLRDTERLVAQHATLVTAAGPYLRALSRAAGGYSHAAMISDARAVVLDAAGDEQTLHGPDPVPGPGSLLDERTIGVNGVGTPLTEGRYVEIVGPEHFIEGFHPFTCQGIPLRDGMGRVVGALSTLVRRPEVSLRLRDMLLCAAHGIEAELLSVSLEGRLVALLADPDPAQRILERLYLDLIQRHALARMRVELASQQLGLGLSLSAADVITLALRSLEDYRREAAFWRALASSEQGGRPLPVELDETARDLALLLQGEAANHHCRLVLHEIESATVQADPGALRSTLLRAFITALEQGRGGAVLVDVRREPDRGLVSLTPRPGPGVVTCAPRPIVVAVPLCPTSRLPAARRS